MAKHSIPEHFLHTLWKEQRDFLREDLRIADGSPVSILDPGTFNEHRGGPDFLNARIALEGLAVSGDVELHREPQHWSDHEHDRDARYGQVVLHVVLECGDDAEEHLRIPTLVLRDNLAVTNEILWKQLFERLYDRVPELKCFPHNMLLPVRHKRKVVERFGEARLDELVSRFESSTHEEWEQRVYTGLLDALGYSQNRKPFKDLSEILTPRVVRQALAEFKDPDLTIEALFFGTAGLLASPSSELSQEANEHIIDLQSRWSAIGPTIALPMVLAESDWAFFRIRPLNSPHRRLAAAALLTSRFFTGGVEKIGNTLDDLTETTGLNPFWESRTSFRQSLEKPHSLFGRERVQAMMLNIVQPATIARMTVTKSELRELRAEWGNDRTGSSARYLQTIEQELLEGEPIRSVRSEQGALFLQRNYCEQARCAECPIGSRLIEKGWTR